MKKVLSVLLSLAIVFVCMPVSASANADPAFSRCNDENFDIEEFLNNSDTTQVIVSSEKQMLLQALDAGVLTREELNEELYKMANMSISELEKDGYTLENIDIIKSYCDGDDAFTHVYGDNTTRAIDAELTFRYGLKENDSQRSVTIVYEIKWDDYPFWQFDDSYGIGWIAADKNSMPLATKIDKTEQKVEYYTCADETYIWDGYVETKTTSGRALVGVFDMSGPAPAYTPSNYGKIIQGTIKVSTQSNSNNIETIQIFVDYQHTIVSASFSWDVALTPNISDIAVSFTPSVSVNQIEMANGSHTFQYNSRLQVEA